MRAAGIGERLFERGAIGQQDDHSLARCEAISVRSGTQDRRRRATPVSRLAGRSVVLAGPRPTSNRACRAYRVSGPLVVIAALLGRAISLRAKRGIFFWMPLLGLRSRPPRDRLFKWPQRRRKHERKKTFALLLLGGCLLGGRLARGGLLRSNRAAFLAGAFLAAVLVVPVLANVILLLMRARIGSRTVL